jgi:signal transduction histidine kinase/CheY-like chemotaxis protein
LRLLRRSNRALILAADEDSLLQDVCRIAVEEGGYRMAMVAFAERDEAKSWRPAAYAGVEGGFVRGPTVSWAEDSEYGRGPGGTAVRTGQPSISRDVLNDPHLAAWRNEAVRRGYRSVVALPLKSEGQAFGVLAIHSCEVDGFDADEVDILSELASNLAFGIVTLRERNQVEVEAAARRAAEASSRAKSEFLSRMSHELRTPLNAVLGFSQLLLADAQNRLTAQQMAQLEHIRGAGWHLLALINDLLDVSRIEIGQLQVQAQAVELGPLLDEALYMTEPVAQTHGVNLDIAGGKQGCTWVLADPIRLRQVLINLLSNAVKYNRPGGSVRLEVADDGEAVLIDVIDSGIGMTPDQLAHLYEPFNRLGQERSGVQGTGIGLVLTRQLVRLMQGRMDVDSEVGRGTRVRISLQAHRANEADDSSSFMPSLRAALDPPRGDAPTPAGVVLYIEDNPVNQMLVEQLLTRWSAVLLVQAEDGANGIELARTLRPDLVLLDMQLPDMDGLAVLDALHADPATRDLVVVVLSASAMPESVAEARARGVSEYWTKPLDFDRFLADMQRLLTIQHK